MHRDQRRSTEGEQWTAPHTLSQHSENNGKPGRNQALSLRPYRTTHPFCWHICKLFISHILEVWSFLAFQNTIFNTFCQFTLSGPPARWTDWLLASHRIREKGYPDLAVALSVHLQWVLLTLSWAGIDRGSQTPRPNPSRHPLNKMIKNYKGSIPCMFSTF